MSRIKMIKDNFWGNYCLVKNKNYKMIYRKPHGKKNRKNIDN